MEFWVRFLAVTGICFYVKEVFKLACKISRFRNDGLYEFSLNTFTIAIIQGRQRYLFILRRPVVSILLIFTFTFCIHAVTEFKINKYC